MSPGDIVKLLVFLIIAIQLPNAAIRTVSQDVADGGQYQTITNALKDAQEGDEIVILDLATYKEQVTIDKNRITLRSPSPTTLSKKPIIQFRDTLNVGPRTYEESQVEEKINFDKNGAVRIMNAQGCKIEGITVDGGGAYPFAYSGIWNGSSALFHGNAAITLYVAGDVTIRNCELRNAYFGINFKDRNEGGIFANSNPADLAKWRVVPLSGFGKTGNHLIENNRIHNNSWAMFFESSWDLGTTIRYNLIYENHHTSTLGRQVKSMPDGGLQPGGAMLFKDDLFSPIAIYNNTFWHNHTFLCGLWRSAAQHLIFNNIIAEPYMLWSQNRDFQYPQDYTYKFVNLLKHNLFASQVDTPVTRTENYELRVKDPETGKDTLVRKRFTGISQVRITGEINNVEATGEDVPVSFTYSSGIDTVRYFRANFVIHPGALITSPFPNTTNNKSNNRWLEPVFQSTDPTDPRFLTPDWDDPVMKEFIVDRGWPAAGVYDGDGSIADIGAIPYSTKQDEVILIKPTEPVSISNTTATAAFNLQAVSGTIKNPTIKYVKWIDALPINEEKKVLTLNDNIINVTPNITSVTEGINKIQFTVPLRTSANTYGFIQIVVTGVNDKGDTVTSNVGFLPYRALAYKFIVRIQDPSTHAKLTEVRAGTPVEMIVIPVDSSGRKLTAHVDTAEVSLGSSYSLLDGSLTPFRFKRNFTVADSVYSVVFTKVPPNGVLENVSVSGIFLTNTSDSIGSAIRGTSDGFKVLPGPADHVKFFDPPSNGTKIADPGSGAVVRVTVYDKYDNIVDKDEGAEVTLTSTMPSIGDVDGPATIRSDDTGNVTFKIKVTNGAEKDTFPLVATLVSNNKADSAKGVVGKTTDMFVIFYSDTASGYDRDNVRIEGLSGDRFAVTIIASTSTSMDDIVATRNTEFNIEFPNNAGVLNAYANKNDTLPITTAKLVNGKAVIWITSTGNAVSNAGILVLSSDLSIKRGEREKIYFTVPVIKVKSAAYYADNGFGQVDRLELFYEDTLRDESFLPDSIELFWPLKIEKTRMLVSSKSLMTLDPSNKRHVTVRLQPPFDTAITAAGSTNQLGELYWKNPGTPMASVQIVKFSVGDSIGPLLKTATLFERLTETGNDTMVVTFTEAVAGAAIEGQTLKLIRNNGADTVALNILEAANIGGDTMRLVVENAGVNSPASGDLLKINASGTIADMYGNSADPANRPVPVIIKPVSADIIDAFYFDTDADGNIDSVAIRFNKSVNKDDLRLLTTFNMDTFSFSSNALIKTANPAGLWVNVESRYSTNLNGVVSGNMVVTVWNTGFPLEAPKKKDAIDKAGPVLKNAAYLPGKPIPGVVGKYETDTLFIEFGENVTAPLAEEMYSFYSSTGTYSVRLENQLPVSTSTKYWYLVKNVTSSPVDGDSVNLLIGKAADGNGNFQNNPLNKKVKLEVKERMATIDTRVGPNPYTIGDGNAVFLTTALTNDIEMKGEIAIYDRFGNLIKKITKNDTSMIDLKSGLHYKCIRYEWDGSNLSGRLVGAGTYVWVAKIQKKENGVWILHPELKKDKISVKR
ncbi:MAG: hypothetical protein GX639_09645 [Fibrobacter sp.]|nr:hypothetical protein [Fibrobacter sp.]